MQTIQIVLDKPLLQATDRAARRIKVNRSELVRQALREHLRRIEIRAQEEQERAAYKAQPEDIDEVRLWETVAVWPED